jgi:hypothetical protein
MRSAPRPLLCNDSVNTFQQWRLSFLCGRRGGYVTWLWLSGGVEDLHRDTASRRRRQQGESQIWESKIWTWVPRDSDPRKTRLARTSSIYKRQSRPLVWEGASQNQDRKCQRVIYLVMSPKWCWTPRITDWLTVGRNVTLTLTWLWFGSQ